ncbi:hypothetical protein M8494_36370 [Serratia ureilytica]
MQNTRYGWLFWRLALYAALAWGFWKTGMRRAANRNTGSPSSVWPSPARYLPGV